MTARVPNLLVGLVDDTAGLPPASVSVADALLAHRRHRASWYEQVVGRMVATASQAGQLAAALAADPDPAEAPDFAEAPGLGGDQGFADALNHSQYPRITLMGDSGPAPRGLGGLLEACAALPVPVEIDTSVAMRGQDPGPGLDALLDLEASLGDRVGTRPRVYAEIPLTWGLLASLDRLAEARAGGAAVAAKFRTGGLAAELFPTPVELAAVICACRDRNLPFKLTAGLGRAIRRTDPETGLLNHGFLNVLCAVVLAELGAEPVDLAELLAATDPIAVVEALHPALGDRRPLWVSFGSPSIVSAVGDLQALGLCDAVGVEDPAQPGAPGIGPGR